MSVKDCLSLGVVSALSVAVANHLPFSLTCEAKELACRAYPEHPHSPEELHASVGSSTNTATHTATGPNPNDVTLQLTGSSARFTAGQMTPSIDVSLSGISAAASTMSGNLTVLPPLSTGTMVDGDEWS